jgi:hypothetical protein
MGTTWRCEHSLTLQALVGARHLDELDERRDDAHVDHDVHHGGVVGDVAQCAYGQLAPLRVAAAVRRPRRAHQPVQPAQLHHRKLVLRVPRAQLSVSQTPAKRQGYGQA